MEKDSLCRHVIFERNGKERPGFTIKKQNLIFGQNPAILAIVSSKMTMIVEFPLTFSVK